MSDALNACGSLFNLSTLSRMVLRLFVFAVLTCSAVLAHAGTITVTASNSGSSLVLAWSGTWDKGSDYINPTSGSGSGNYALLDGSGSFPPFQFYSEGTAHTDDVFTLSKTGATFNNSLISGQHIGTASGDNFRITDAALFEVSLPENYSSGTSLAGTMTFTNTSIADVFGTRLDSGPVQYFTQTNGGVTNTINFQSVPEPSTYAMLIAGGLAMGGAAMRRRQRRLVRG